MPDAPFINGQLNTLIINNNKLLTDRQLQLFIAKKNSNKNQKCAIKKKGKIFHF